MTAVRTGRVRFLALSLALAAASGTDAAQAVAQQPALQGLDSVPIGALTARIRAGRFGLVDRFVVVRNGYVVRDERFVQNYDSASRGKATPLGCGIDACRDSSELHDFNYLHPRFHPWYQGRDVHTLQSVTKSVTATLIGIGQARGEIKDLETPLLSFFGAYDVTQVDPRLQKATLTDLLTMRSGIEWHENDRPLDETNTTGMHVDKYAEQYLFGPLGIRDYHWKKTPTGHPDTEGGLYLGALDLAKHSRA